MGLLSRIGVFAALAVFLFFAGAQCAQAVMAQAGWNSRWYGAVEGLVEYLLVPLLACVLVLLVVRMLPKCRAASPIRNFVFPLAIVLLLYVFLDLLAFAVADAGIAGMTMNALPLLLGCGYLVWWRGRYRRDRVLRIANDPRNIYS